MRFTDPDGRSAMDTMNQLGRNWTNVGFGYFNADLGKYIDYEVNILNPAQVLETRSYLDGGGGNIAGGGTSDYLMRYFDNSGSVTKLLNVVEQLKKAGFKDPDGRSAMDTVTQLGGNWTNVGLAILTQI